MQLGAVDWRQKMLKSTRRNVNTKPPGEQKIMLFRLSIQNMMTLVSFNLMLFLDRIILAKHGTASLSASLTAGSICNIFIFGAIAIASIADVFIGRYFGAQEHKKIGQIVWQMLWFSITIAGLFLLISIFGHQYLPLHSGFSSEAETYFRWQMAVGFLPVIIATLNSFFLGTQRFGFALIAVVVASLCKLILVVPLVFGINGFFSGFGIKGTISATAISQILHIIILAWVVFRKSNRDRYGSGDCAIRPQVFLSCVRIGFPQCLGTMLNYAAWSTVVGLLTVAGEKHLMMYTIIDSLYALFGFTTEGLQKGVLAIAAGLIGSGQSAKVPALFRNAVFLLVPILLVLALPLLFFPDVVLFAFNDIRLNSVEIYSACFITWIHFCFDGLSWILSGLLTALGDTFFVGPVNALASIVSGVGVTYFMTKIVFCQPEITCWVSAIYGLFNAVLLLMRFRTWNFSETKAIAPSIAIPIFNPADINQPAPALRFGSL